MLPISRYGNTYFKARNFLNELFLKARVLLKRLEFQDHLLFPSSLILIKIFRRTKTERTAQSVENCTIRNFVRAYLIVALTMRSKSQSPKNRTRKSVEQARIPNPRLLKCFFSRAIQGSRGFFEGQTTLAKPRTCLVLLPCNP